MTFRSDMKAIEIKITIPESVYSKWYGVEKYGVNVIAEQAATDIEKVIRETETLRGFEIESNVVENEES
jgi:hypothetical protein